MLSDVDVDNLIQPFVDRQHDIEQYVINLIAQHIKEIGEVLPSDVHRLERLYKSGSNVREINEQIAKMTGLQLKELKQLIKVVAADCYIDAKPYYDYRHIPYIPFAQNKGLQTLINALDRQTNSSFRNLANSRAIGFVIRDLKHPAKKKFYNIDEAYKSVIDEAVQATSQRVTDYHTAMRRTLKQLNESGLKRLEWESGYTQRADTAVKRNILDGVRGINQKIHEWLAKKIQANGYEITAHHAPAPDHAPWQGHILKEKDYDKLQSNKPFKDVKGNKFPAQKRILGQYNCKHFAYPIIIGVSKPKYSDEELQKILEDNEKGITLPNGRHLTLYEATQYQNQLALKVRKAKDGQIMAKNAGDIQLAKEYQIDVNKYTKDYKTFNKIAKEQEPTWTDRDDKLTVSGYKKISTI